MAKVINLQQIKDRLVRRKVGKSMTYSECMARTEYYYHTVDIGLMMKGWEPIDTIPIYKNFFIKMAESRRRRAELKLNTLEKMGKYSDGTTRCMVIYKK